MSTKGKRDFRPKIHFSPETGWMNDPNGMVYVNGTYHFCYQKYPHDTKWGPMHWGHAVSQDLIHWEHLPIALYPDELGYIFSGSAVYDKKNVSGYGTGENPPIIAMYTSHDAVSGLEQQSIAYSVDGGCHFEKSYLNPVIPNPDLSDFRDPKMFWNPVKQCWGMVLAAFDRAIFYSSEDLKHWEKTGEFGPGENHVPGVWECPDLIPVKYKDETVWALLLSMTKTPEVGRCRMQYFLGDFDGEKFVCTHPADGPLWFDEGFDDYAAVSFQNCDEPLVMGWAMNWEYAADTPTNEYCGQATLARRLGIVDTGNGLRLAMKPMGVEEFQHKAYSVENNTAIHTETFGLKVKGNGDGQIELRNAVGQKIKIKVENDEIAVDRSLAGCKEFNEGFKDASYSVASVHRMIEGNWEMELIFDVSVLEVFADEGLEVFTMTVYPDTPYDKVTWRGNLSVELYEIDA